MSKRPTRIIEGAIFEGDIGPLSAQELIQMSEGEWGVLRDMITDKRHGGGGLEAKCLRCENPVFIQSRFKKGVRLPYFAHYRGGDIRCPWYHGKTNNPDNVRAAQYHGQKESLAHRLMCEKIAEVVQLDPRYLKHNISQYLPPTESSYGRYPDVYVEWERIGPFAIEFQLSKTFQTEVSQRCLYYRREGIPLIWVLWGGAIKSGEDIPQSFRDVIRRHRGNAFVFDSAASKASFKQKSLVLSCYLAKKSGLDPPELVRFDELIIPPNKLPYHEDRLIKPRLEETAIIRKPWFDALGKWDKEHYDDDAIQRARSALPMQISQDAVILIAASFSIVAKAAGRERNYASRHKGSNCVTAMLNSYLQNNNGRLAPYVALLTKLLKNTKANDILLGSVKRHFDRIAIEQVSENSPEWKAISYLLPEALDPLWRKELAYFNELPEWVVIEDETNVDDGG